MGETRYGRNPLLPDRELCDIAKEEMNSLLCKCL